MRWLSVLLLLGGTLLRAAEQPTLPAQLTLSQALQIALSNSSSIREALARLDQASGQFQQARSPLLPQLNAILRQGYQTLNLNGAGLDLRGYPQLIGPFGSMEAKVFLSQELLNLAQVRAWQGSRSQREASRLLVTNARELVVMSVVAAYLEALRAKATRDTLAEQRRLADELYKLTRERVNQGAAAELDANRAMQKVNSLAQYLQEAEQTFVLAKLNLANILQARVSAEFDVADDAAYGATIGLEHDAAINQALTSRPDYLSAQASLDAARLLLKSAKASHLPTIGMVFEDGQSGSTPAHNVNTYGIQGKVEIPIFTGEQIRGQVTQAEGKVREATAVLDANRTQIETDVLSAISGVEWALKEVETSAGNVKLSREEVEFTRSRYGQGVADNTEVVNAQDRLTQADQAHIRAQFTLGLARANLARATGSAEKTYVK